MQGPGLHLLLATCWPEFQAWLEPGLAQLIGSASLAVCYEAGPEFKTCTGLFNVSQCRTIVEQYVDCMFPRVNVGVQQHLGFS